MLVSCYLPPCWNFCGGHTMIHQRIFRFDIIFSLIYVIYSTCVYNCTSTVIRPLLQLNSIQSQRWLFTQISFWCSPLWIFVLPMMLQWKSTQLLIEAKKKCHTSWLNWYISRIIRQMCLISGCIWEKLKMPNYTSFSGNYNKKIHKNAWFSIIQYNINFRCPSNYFEMLNFQLINK